MHARLGAFGRAAALSASVLLSACGATQRPDGGSGLLPVGAVAPNFEARDAAGKVVTLADSAGRPRVVYFYPKDETPGCTKEACAFRDAYGKYEARGVVVFGVSHDTEESHAAFRKHHSLPFPLVADEHGAVQRAYGVPSRLGFASRVSFLVGRDGRVERVWKDVDPVIHAADVLAAVK
jgi:thioredoxin-dependent peroxiredoxin